MQLSKWKSSRTMPRIKPRTILRITQGNICSDFSLFKVFLTTYFLILAIPIYSSRAKKSLYLLSLSQPALHQSVGRDLDGREWGGLTLDPASRSKFSISEHNTTVSLP